jgi:nucleoside phosphorylase
MSTPYVELQFDEAKKYFSEDVILLVTATQTESAATHKRLQSLNGYVGILKVHKGALTFYLGIFGNYKVVHVQCSMGSISRDSSIVTITDALNLIPTKAVIMVGIAFGVDKKSQKIGDVLVAEAIQPYDNKRIGNEEIQRSYQLLSSKILLDRFKNIKTWEYLVDGQKAKLFYTLLLSGEQLIDNSEHRDKLVGKFPLAKGGEMEGAGVYSACNGKAECILVKGICDFADGNKSQNKKENQEVAIDSALSACLEVFSSLSAFKDLGINPYVVETDSVINGTNSNQVLFEVYDKTKRDYYILRDEDQTLAQLVPQTNIWIYGPSGCGKSNLIIRNLVENERPFIQVTLASCVGLSVDDFFKEIVLEISAKVAAPLLSPPSSFSESCRQLIGLLDKYYGDKNLFIFVEEIPLGTLSQHKEFAEKMFSLLISKSYATRLSRIKFILSCIDNPTQHIAAFQQKIHQHVEFIDAEYWQDSDVIKLVDTIEKELQFKLQDSERKMLIEYCKGSPRFIKKVFRSVCMTKKTDPVFIQEIIRETERELRNG